MATRIYLPNGLLPPISPAFKTTWTVWGEATRQPCYTYKPGTAFAEKAASEAVTASGAYVLVRQYITGRLAAQTISGTVKGQIRAKESNAAADFCRTIIIYVVSADGKTIRGTLYQLLPSALTAEFVAALTNRYYPPSASVTTLAIQNGDRIVIEIGFRAFNAVATAYTGTLEFGDANANDLPEDETDTNQYCPWIEFSQNLVGVADEITKDGTPAIKFSGVGVLTSTIPGTTVIPEGLTGFVFSGEGVLTETFPQADEVVAEGGFQLAGAGVVTIYDPSLGVLVGSGGIKFGGAGVWGQVDPSDLPITVLVGSGGFVLAGTGLQPDITPTLTAIIGSGGFKMGGRRPDSIEVIYPGDYDETIDELASFEMGGEGVWGASYPGTTVIVSDGAIFKIGGAGIAAAKSPPLVVITGDGGFAIGGSGWPAATGADTVVLTGNEFGPSLYSNFNFTSYAQYRGQYYGAKDDGIYLLGGSDDAGDEIHPGVRIGPTNLGTANYKRLRSVNVGENSNGAKVGVRAGERRSVSPVKQGKAFIPRDLQAREMVIDIIDFEQLSHLEIIALIIAWD